MLTQCGNVITDLTAYATMFKHLSTYGTALAEKPTMGASEKYEFWKISYDLDGGNAKGLVYYYNKDTGAITLPVPTWNIYHEFKGWSLTSNGPVVSNINISEDTTVYAIWEIIPITGITLPLISVGGDGIISVVSNLAPAAVVEMAHKALEGDFDAARKAHYKLLPFFKAAFVDGNPTSIKYAMSVKGMPSGPCRLPLAEVNDGAKKVIEDALKECGL